MFLVTVLLMLKVVVLPMPSEVDLQELGAILCGEARGMPYEAKRLVGENIRRDWYWYGTEKINLRWYGYKPDSNCVDFMREVFNSEFQYPYCRLIGNKYDPQTWVQRGVLDEGAEPEFFWSVLDGRFVIQAFGCEERVLKVKPVIKDRYFIKEIAL